MWTLAELVQEYMDKDRPAGVILDDEQVMQQLIAATRMYASYGRLSVSENDTASFEEITVDTVINTSEWGVIRPLFMLYVERETAIQLEASRAMGVEVYGRSVSEIAGEIMQVEAELPHRAFMQPVLSL